MINLYGNKKNITIIDTENIIDITFLGWVYEDENEENERYIAG